MRKLIILICLGYLCSTSTIEAQNPDYPIGISVKALMMDYQSQNGGSLTAFKDFHPGFEIGLNKRLQDKLRINIPFKFGVVKSHNETEGLRKTVMGADVQFQYHFFKPESVVIPYVMAGFGAVTEFDGEFNPQVPAGVGLNFRVSDNTYVNMQGEYRYSFSEDRNNLHYGLGFVYLIGGENTKKDMDDALADDSDGDGIIDDLDLCPNAAGPKELNGCPDRDGDGIADFQDACPDFPGLKIFKGCPDSDGDGVSDNEDECPNLAGVKANNGCPDNDRDSDGIPDNQDACPDLPGVAPDGCPKDDRDRDGILDNLDKCPDEPGSANTDGCPDTDGDGVADFEDNCPKKPGSRVYNGCPDTDGDGIDDSRDKCINSPGPVASGGCPEISSADRQVLELAMRAVQFDTGKAVLKTESYDILSQIGQILKRYPDYNLVIAGHTDNTGSAVANQRLSERRAKACYEFLTKNGVSASRLSYAGYGESRPISDNNTLRGRALNRRVEFNMVPRN